MIQLWQEIRKLLFLYQTTADFAMLTTGKKSIEIMICHWHSQLSMISENLMCDYFMTVNVAMTNAIMKSINIITEFYFCCLLKITL